VPPEVRHKKCIDRTFDVAKLPKVSLVIPYLHETWEQMHATVASILAYSPQEILDKILFVDDSNSEEWEHHADLEGLHPKIKVHRNEERQGLIRSKVIGASMVSSDVIVFMEPHCVVGRHWLEPLLERLATSADHSTLVMPGIDIIPEEDFNGYKVANHHIGGFDWSLTFNWMALIEERNKSYTYPDPYPTPALSGGIFGIWKDYWDRMGTYDVNMTEWGGEHIEMSLRMWRCGARLEIVPCSRLGHVFRARNPYVVHPPLVIRNLKRAALVWLDERLEDFYSSVPAARNMDAGDVEERRRLKESLGCKSMTWYVENVYPELNAEQPRRR
jgi:polypeptide N-acetylgalactosaminyltransferase